MSTTVQYKFSWIVTSSVTLYYKFFNKLSTVLSVNYEKLSN